MLFVAGGIALAVTASLLNEGRERTASRATATFSPQSEDVWIRGSGPHADTMAVFIDLTDSLSRHLLLAMDSVQSIRPGFAHVFVYHVPRERVAHSLLIALMAECSHRKGGIAVFARELHGLYGMSDRSLSDWLGRQVNSNSARACSDDQVAWNRVTRGWHVADDMGVTQAPSIVRSGRIHSSPTTILSVATKHALER